MDNDISDKNLFMMCSALNPDALAPLPDSYHLRNCRRDELEVWKAMHFDGEETVQAYHGYMTHFFHDVYGNQESLFFQKCMLVCNADDRPIGTCFWWKAYGNVTTIHWFKALRQYEGIGIGRALLSMVMKSIPQGDYPVYLHTQPSSYRAIKLYSDFGFALLTDPIIGYRQNDLKACLPYLKAHLFQTDYDTLQFVNAPEEFLQAVRTSSINQF